MFKVRYKGKILTVYHVEPKPVLQFLVYTDKQGVFKSGRKCRFGGPLRQSWHKAFEK